MKWVLIRWNVYIYPPSSQLQLVCHKVAVVWLICMNYGWSCFCLWYWWKVTVLAFAQFSSRVLHCNWHIYSFLHAFVFALRLAYWLDINSTFLHEIRQLWIFYFVSNLEFGCLVFNWPSWKIKRNSRPVGSFMYLFIGGRFNIDWILLCPWYMFCAMGLIAC